MKKPDTNTATTEGFRVLAFGRIHQEKEERMRKLFGSWKEDGNDDRDLEELYKGR